MKLTTQRRFKVFTFLREKTSDDTSVTVSLPSLITYSFVDPVFKSLKDYTNILNYNETKVCKTKM